MNNRTFQVSEDFVREALNARYAEVESQWGNEITEFFWDDFVDMIIECGGPGDKNVSEIVDNYLINSDAGYVEDYKDNENETDEEVIERLEPLFYNTENKFVMVSA